MSEPIDLPREAALSREHGAGRSGHNLDVVRRRVDVVLVEVKDHLKENFI